ncbi:MAG: ACP S-malonyltransferase [Planctomycetes bacterium]|nr:ACP S-malonyltransferase [Planctomycetota bacterium]
MTKAYVYPGQGAQAVGMGADLLDSPLGKTASEICGFDLVQTMSEGPAELLQSTAYCQPALFLHSALVMEEMEKRGLELDAQFHLGLSLGEYTALYGAGVMSFEDVMSALAVRGQAMQDACDITEGGMVSVIGLDAQTVIDVCDKARGNGVLQAANFNAPGQIVVSGDMQAVERSLALLKEAGARRAMPLKVAGAFHSALMAPAAEKLEECLKKCTFKEGAEKVISNVTAEAHDPSKIIETLVAQITAPVLWSQSIENLIAKGVDSFSEWGTGKILSGLIKRVSKEVNLEQAGSKEDLDKLFAVAE